MRSGNNTGYAVVNLITLGDIHLEERSPRYIHALEVLDHCIDVGIQRNAKVWICCGDVFEGEPTPGEYHAFLRRVYRIIEHGGMVAVVRGNHEAYSAYSFFELLSPMIRVAWDSCVTIDWGSTRILLIPYPVRYRPPFDVVNQETIAGSMRGAVDVIANEIRKAVERAQPLLVFGHWTIEGESTRDADFERHSPNEVVVPIAALAQADLVKTGHIHKAQQVTEKIGSVGSLYRTSFAEADDPKIFCLITVADDGTITTEDIPTGCRGMREYTLALDEIPLMLSTIEAEATAGNEIKITISMESTDVGRYDPATFDKIRAAAPYLLIEKDVRPVQRVRAPALRANMDLTEEFMEWARVTEIPVEARRAGLRTKLSELT